MSDGLRIDLALPRAAGLPPPSSDATGTPHSLPRPSWTPASTDPTFSRLALLLARMPAPDASAPALSPDDARLLQAYLQQRVASVLRDAGVAVPTGLCVTLDADGAVRLAPSPPDGERVTPLIAHAPDIARLAQWLHAARIATGDIAQDDERPDALPPRASTVTTPDAHRIWPWRFASSHDDEAMRTTRGIPAAALLFLAAGLLWLAWRLFA